MVMEGCQIVTCIYNSVLHYMCECCTKYTLVQLHSEINAFLGQQKVEGESKTSERDCRDACKSKWYSLWWRTDTDPTFWKNSLYHNHRTSYDKKLYDKADLCLSTARKSHTEQHTEQHRHTDTHTEDSRGIRHHICNSSNNLLCFTVGPHNMT